MKTWHLELVFVTLTLAGVVYLSGAPRIEWVGAVAVLLSFAHGQVSDRLAEKEARRTVDTVECYTWSRRYWIAKESVWVLYFVYKGAYSALVGCGIFLLYPLWRQFYRKRKPLAKS